MAAITYKELQERGLEDGALKHFLMQSPINVLEAEMRGFADCLKKKLGRSTLVSEPTISIPMPDGAKTPRDDSELREFLDSPPDSGC